MTEPNPHTDTARRKEWEQNQIPEAPRWTWDWKWWAGIIGIAVTWYLVRYFTGTV